MLHVFDHGFDTALALGIPWAAYPERKPHFLAELFKLLRIDKFTIVLVHNHELVLVNHNLARYASVKGKAID